MKQLIGNLRTTLSRWSDAVIILPLLLLILLGVIWSSTYLLIQVELDNARSHAARVSQEELHTYEAQMIRSLREIDQALRTVKYAYERGSRENVLNTLNNQGLLPPVILFSIGITDANGKLTSSLGWGDTEQAAVNPTLLAQLRQSDELAISHTQPSGPESLALLLGRRLETPDSAFAGAVVIKVDASYFISSYESNRLGDEGLMGLLGSDGHFLALRLSEKMAYGTRVDYANEIAGKPDEIVAINRLSPDGIPRHTVARQLYGYPLAVVVGVSESEQLEKAQGRIDEYVLQAIVGSIALILFIAILFYGNRQLRLSRRREREAAVLHAAQVEHLAFHDTLTGLPNRGLFNKLLQQELMQAKRHNRSLSLLFLDLDHFKYINDTMGHDIGDQLLIQVAQRLSACLRQSDVVARLGGDEFVILLPGQSLDEYAEKVAEKILAAVAQPFNIKEHEFWITVSIGISKFPQDGADEQALMKNADIAMYQAKTQGKNNFRYYSNGLSQLVIERMNLEAELRQALQRQEFQLHYQCRFNKDGTVSGVEALLRWQHPELGLVGPAHFLEAAETMGLTIALGKWVMTTACAQLMTWQRLGLPRFKMAVNLTARQFEDDHLLQDLQKILVDTGMDPALLELEIPQAVLRRDIDYAVQRLATLKERGIRIVVDDFGEGYSSLATLKSLPLDAISMPRSFMAGTTYQYSHLAAGVIALGKALGLCVLAKGVENEVQAQFLQMQPCDEIQGFYFNKPMEAGEIEEVLRSQPPSIELNNP